MRCELELRKGSILTENTEKALWMGCRLCYKNEITHHAGVLTNFPPGSSTLAPVTSSVPLIVMHETTILCDELLAWLISDAIVLKFTVHRKFKDVCLAPVLELLAPK